MEYTYALTPTGFVIYRGGAPYIDQPFNPELPGRVPFETGAAGAAAQALIAELTSPPEPVAE